MRPLVLIAIITVGCGATPTSPSGSPANGTRIATIRGRVQDAVSRPIADARVTIVDGPQAGLSTTTNEDGRFAFAPFTTPSDATALRIEKAGFAPVTPRWGTRDEGSIALQSLTPLDIEGQYTITFAAAAACSQLPAAAQTRTYTAAISPTRPDRLNFTSTLTGAEFQRGYDTFFAGVASDAARLYIYSWDAFNWWLEDDPIIERLTPTSHLSISGTATTAVSSNQSTITAAFDGTFSFCAESKPGAQPQWPPTCAVPPLECTSPRHQLTMTARLDPHT